MKEQRKNEKCSAKDNERETTPFQNEMRAKKRKTRIRNKQTKKEKEQTDSSCSPTTEKERNKRRVEMCEKERRNEREKTRKETTSARIEQGDCKEQIRRKRGLFQRASLLLFFLCLLCTVDAICA